ncbi:HigA family addiction module antitoxin [Hyphomicrobium sp. ghe19]|uniref:HigA family addiction module antitoxin n=1 Tax=Hyphomicrobium sp. ghe19 TaxID=2682968 RepID=UPI001366A2DA|nr:putative HTH-type transcriptional regulator YbaQ [Hyphomicrobium sp. ghe19]
MARIRTHPGKIIWYDYCEPRDWSVRQFAEKMSMTPEDAVEIILGERRVDGETAARLASLFNTTQGFWLHLQRKYDASKLKAAKRADY